MFQRLQFFLVNQTRPLLMLFLLHFVIFGNIEYIFYSRRRCIFFVLLFLCNVYFTSKAAMASNNCSSHLQTCCIAQFIAKKLWQNFHNDGVGILSSSTHMTDLWDPCLYLKTLNISYTGWPKKNGTVDTVDFFQDFALINSYLFSPCWIEHLFLIIITPRSSNLVENFLFYE